MISIVICARQHDISPSLRENIEQTIGISHEIIVINNAGNRYSIFGAYNEGVRQSQYPLVLFMHDDIQYHSQDWGAKVIEHFKDEKTGAIGVAGTPYVSFMPGGWWSTGIGYLYLLHSSKETPTPALQNYSNDLSAGREAVALDGVWFCIRKNLFERIHFDEKTYDGFHVYDVDTTLQVHQLGYKLICITDILIEHFSAGMLDEKWIHYLLVFREKWKALLPVSCVKMSLSQQCHVEYRVLNVFTGDQLRVKGHSRREKRRIHFDALKRLVSFRRGYGYYKTPFWIAKFFFRYLGSFFA